MSESKNYVGPIRAVPGVGLEVDMRDFEVVRLQSGEKSLWYDKDNRDNLLFDKDCLISQFLARFTERREEPDVAIFEYKRASRELASKSVPIEPLKGIPESLKKQLELAIEELQAKAEDPKAVEEAREYITSLRLPDPKSSPDMYRLYKDGTQDRLLVLWGCNRKGASPLLPLDAVQRIPSYKSSVLPKILVALSGLIGLLLLLLLLLKFLPDLWPKDGKQLAKNPVVETEPPKPISAEPNPINPIVIPSGSQIEPTPKETGNEHSRTGLRANGSEPSDLLTGSGLGTTIPPSNPTPSNSANADGNGNESKENKQVPNVVTSGGKVPFQGSGTGGGDGGSSTAPLNPQSTSSGRETNGQVLPSIDARSTNPNLQSNSAPSSVDNSALGDSFKTNEIRTPKIKTNVPQLPEDSGASEHERANDQTKPKPAEPIKPPYFVVSTNVLTHGEAITIDAKVEGWLTIDGHDDISQIDKTWMAPGKPATRKLRAGFRKLQFEPDAPEYKGNRDLRAVAVYTAPAIKNRTVTLSLEGNLDLKNLNVDWGDGSPKELLVRQKSFTHEYPNKGEYELKIIPPQELSWAGKTFRVVVE